MTADSSWLSNLGPTALLAALPFVVIVGTSFAKVAVVLGFTRSALGAPGVPPVSVMTALAAVVSLFVMAPVVSDIAAGLEEGTANMDEQPDDALGIARARVVYEAGAPPLLSFLDANTPDEDIEFFSDLAQEPADRGSVRILLPAFALSEIKEAFLIGFLVFVPFLVIDLIVGNTLQALGMHMTSPAAIALPFKLLLFVSVDGWELLVNGLVVTYGA